MSDPTQPPWLLPLDDDRWGMLSHAYGPATDTPDALAAIEAHPSPTYSPSLADMRRAPTPWEHIFGAVLHQDTVFSATYAALPHLVRIAEAYPGVRSDVLVAMGSALIAQSVAPCPPKLEAGWEWARRTARGWMPQTGLTGYAMSGALCGFLALRHVTELVFRLDHIGTGEVEGACPGCGEYALIELSDAPCPNVRYAEPPMSWPVEETSVVARDVARWAGDETLARLIAALDVPMTCASCGAPFTPAEAAEAERRGTGSD